jgi:putative spermidine/putrescine transport system permease protein
MTRDRLMKQTRAVALHVFALAVVAFLALPLLPIFPLSFTSGASFTFPIPGWSFRWFEAIYDSPRWQAAFRNSLFAATVVSLVATGLGVAASLGLTMAAFRFRSLVLGIVMAPIMVPPIIMAVGMFLLYSQLGLTGTYIAVVLAHTTIALPFVVIIVSSTLARFNRDLLLAAAGLGAPPVVVFRRVLLPLIAPAILAGAVMAFVQSLDEQGNRIWFFGAYCTGLRTGF